MQTTKSRAADDWKLINASFFAETTAAYARRRRGDHVHHRSVGRLIHGLWLATHYRPVQPIYTNDKKPFIVQPPSNYMTIHFTQHAPIAT